MEMNTLLVSCTLGHLKSLNFGRETRPASAWDEKNYAVSTNSDSSLSILRHD